MFEVVVGIIAAIASGIVFSGAYLWYLTSGSDGPDSLPDASPRMRNMDGQEK
jgi:hypothetical protein